MLIVSCAGIALASPADGQTSPGPDPYAQIIGSTYLGGTGYDCPFAAAVAPDGTIVVLGTTYAPDLPVTMDAQDKQFSSSGPGIGDAFAARIDPESGTILSCTYLGGSGGEQAGGVAVDRDGDVYCFGYTTSADFPVSAGAFSTTKQGISDFFVARLDLHLTEIKAATFLGGSLIEAVPASIAISTSGAGLLVLSGAVESPDMPVSPWAFDTDFGGTTEAWIGGLSLDLTKLEFGTFLGGSKEDGVGALAVDADGSMVFVGGTLSPDFPQTVPPWLTASDGRTFVARLSAEGSELLHSGFIGGSSADSFSSLAIDGAGNVYLAGLTWSDDFPVTPGVYDPTPGSLFQDGILVCLAPDLQTLLRSTFAGSATKDIESMVIDSTGSPTYITVTNSGGFVGSPGAWSPFQPPGVSNNWIIIRLDPEFQEVLHATYLGGSGTEGPTLIRSGESGRIIVVGCTESLDYPVTLGASQTSPGGGFDQPDAVITQLSMLPKGVARFGSSTPGCTGDVVASITQSAITHLGWVGLTCTGAPPSSSAGLLAVSLLGQHAPFVAKQVSVWVDPAALVALLPVKSGPSGFARLDLHFPPDPAGALVGLFVATQFLWHDPCGPAEWTASDALWVEVLD